MTNTVKSKEGWVQRSRPFKALKRSKSPRKAISRRGAGKGEIHPIALLIVAVGVCLVIWRDLVFQVAVNLVMMGTPILLLLALARSNRVRRNAPHLAYPSDQNFSEENLRLATLMRQYQQLKERIEAVYIDGHSKGLRYRKTVDDNGPRFREHGREGQELNRELDLDSESLRRTIGQIRAEKMGVYQATRHWQRPHTEWARQYALKRACVISWIFYILSIAALAPFLGEFSKTIQGVAVVRLLPTVLYGPAAVAALPALIALAIMQQWTTMSLENEIDEGLADKWAAHLKRWNPYALPISKVNVPEQ